MKIKSTPDHFQSKGIPALTVLVFAVYPILALYGHNADQLVAHQLVFPLLFSVLFSGIFLGLASTVLRSLLKGSLVTLLFLVLFWNYTLIFNGMNRIAEVRHWHVLPILLVVYAHLFYLISRIRQPKTLGSLNIIFMVPVGLLVIFNTFSIVTSEIRKSGKREKESGNIQGPGNAFDRSKLPDIYLIILDEGASVKTMKEEWGYDAGSFAEEMAKNGFFFAGNSPVRYNQTTWNIPSLLNFEYLTEAVTRTDFMKYIENPQNTVGTEVHEKLHKIDYSVQTEKMNNNRLFRFLKEHGYTIDVMEGLSQHYSGVRFGNTDATFAYQDADPSDLSGTLSGAFYKELINSSMLSSFNFLIPVDKSQNLSFTATRHILTCLEKNTSKLKSPRFTYAHIMCPHVPFVFDRSGNYIEGPSSEGQRSEGYITAQNTVNAAYLEQYIFITGEIARVTANMIRNQPPAGSVIFVQSDHGPRPHEVYLKNREHSFQVLNAVYFPDRDYKDLYDSISPINALRVMLNKYLDARLPKVEDK